MNISSNNNFPSKDLNLRSNVDMGIRKDFSTTINSKNAKPQELQLKAVIEDTFGKYAYEIDIMRRYDNGMQVSMIHGKIGHHADKDPKKGNILTNEKGYNGEYYYNDTTSCIKNRKFYQACGDRTYEDTKNTYSYSVEATTKKSLGGDIIGLKNMKKEVTLPDGSQQIVECMKKGGVYHYTQKYIPAGSAK